MGEHRDQVFQDRAEGKICPFTCFCFRRYYMFVQSLILRLCMIGNCLGAKSLTMNALMHLVSDYAQVVQVVGVP